MDFFDNVWTSDSTDPACETELDTTLYFQFDIFGMAENEYPSFFQPSDPLDQLTNVVSTLDREDAGFYIITVRLEGYIMSTDQDFYSDQD